MKKIIGIRREDKNQWEKRVPLIPGDVKQLLETSDLDVIVQPSEIRVFQDEEYERAGAKVDESLSSADVVFAVKEIPLELLEAKKTYVFFSHTIKGQAYNMKMLKQLMNLKCNLIDYEKISDQRNARIITFSLFAGIAGIIETLYAFARKMELKRISTPFNTLKQAYQYRSITQVEEEIKKISKIILKNGISKELHPLTFGISGYGNVAKGVQRILDLLPVKDVTPDQLKEGLNSEELDNKYVYKIVFEEKDLVDTDSGEFNLQDYYLHPEKYKSIFHHYLPEPKILLNCVYWTEDYPRIITRKNLKDSFSRYLEPGLQVIGDISCDIGGAIEITKDSTKPDNACYTYFVEKDQFEDGIRRDGITVMAIDNLPCEFSQEASASFSAELMEYVNAIASADYSMYYQDLQLPDEVKKAVILLNGQLTPDYQYITEFI